ncbi:MAG: serine/threonine protein kinase [Lentisphaeria bacterium]|nr:serine/threonine protein kinase [Lentisphaeria bacterium]
MKFDVDSKIGDYTLLAPCGRGAYGFVFLAENSVTHQRVALKIVYTHGKNFERELKGLQQYQQVCRRTNLLQIYHVGSGNDFFYYTMDAADSMSEEEYRPKTLANLLKEQGKLQVPELRTMAEEVISSLKTLHDKGLMHRDIKPENILWVDGSAVLGDIGLITDHEQTTLAGTPGFMPPEVLAGIRPFGKQDDFYALGKVLYCALTGLPVTQYPSFPESRTLTGAGEIIKLYTKLCAGKSVTELFRKPERKKNWLYIIIIILLAGTLSAIYFFSKKAPMPTPQQTSRPEQKSDVSGYIYTPSQAMLNLLPELRKQYQKLEQELSKAKSSISFNVTPKELAEAEKYLALHPENYLVGYPEAYILDQRQKAAEEAFLRQHQNDPIWRYFRNQQEIQLFLFIVNKKVDTSRYSVSEAQNKLQALYLQQRDLETLILKKYQK